MDINTDINSSKKYTLFIFIAFVIISFSLHYFSELSLIKYIFKPFETAMHEFGHGYTSMLLGGSIIDLHLEYNQGSVTHQISSWAAPFASFAGYFSASLFGFLIYASSLYASKILKIFLIIFSSYWLIHVDSLMTLTILLLIIGTFVASWFLKSFGCYLLRFIGVYIMVSSIYSPTYLWAYSDSGDHVSLAEQTLIPSFIWISLWFVIGLAFMYQALKLSFKHDKTKSTNNK